MVNSIENKKTNFSLVLAVGILSASVVNQSSAYTQLPTHSTARTVTLALAVGIPSFIRLYTKSTPKELKYKKELPTSYNSLSDYTQLLKVWNIVLHPYEYAKLIDKQWVGTPLKLEEQEIKEIAENGLKEVTTKKKNIECLPTGICGTIDTYVFKQFEKLEKPIDYIIKAIIAYCLLHNIEIKNIQELWLTKSA